jgi:biotin carboxylase
MREAGVPVPKFFRVSDKEGFTAAVKEMTGAFMVKPADNSGSRGIIKVEDKADSAQVAAAYPYSRANSRSGDVVVEEFMQGPEVSVETLTVDGVCHVIQITDKITTGSPYFVEMGHTQPTAHPAEIAESIRQVAIAANRAVGITNGPSHTEIIVTKEGPKIVELGARLGGDCITTHLTPLSTGVDMVRSCIAIALGEAPDLTPKFSKGSAIRYFNQTPGVVQEISGIEKAEKMPGVRQVSIVHGVGEQVGIINSSAARMGFVIAQGDDRQNAIDLCQKAMDTIQITIS